MRARISVLSTATSLALALTALPAVAAGTNAAQEARSPEGAAVSVRSAPMSFMQAVDQMLWNADQIKMAEADVANAKAKSDAAKWLGGPKVDLNAKQVWGTKTIDMDLGSPSQYIPDHIEKTIISGADVLAKRYPLKDAGKNHGIGLPDDLGDEVRATFQRNVNIHRKTKLDGPRVSIDATWPIFTGGLISAQQDQLRYAVDQASADRDQSVTTLEAQMAGRYWGVQLARSVVALRESVLRDENEALRRAEAFQKRGMISKVEKMAVEVSRNNAKTALDESRVDLLVAENQLKTTLRMDFLPPLESPLFVLSGDIGSLESWKQKALAQAPAISKTRAIANRADQAVKAAKAGYYPKVFAFGSKNLVKHYLTLPEPDWVAGIGVSFTLWDNLDRSANVVAAEQLVTKARAARSEARHQIEEAVETAWLHVNQAKDAYFSTLTTTELAKENLRLRQAAFAQGLATSTELDAARTKLTGAELARRLAAYKYVVSLVMLHAASGTMADLPAVLHRTDIIYER